MYSKRESITKEALATTILRFRHSQNISQQQLAEQSGLTRQYISLLERRLRIPRLDTFLVLCEGLQVDVLEFMMVYVHQLYQDENHESYPLPSRQALQVAEEAMSLYKKSQDS